MMTVHPHCPQMLKMVKVDNKKPVKKTQEEPAKNTSLAKIDPQQLDNAFGLFYVLITKKDTTFYHSTPLLQAAFEELKSKNPYQPAWMRCCKNMGEVEELKLDFNKKFGVVAYVEPSPTKEPSQNNQQHILDMIMESKDVQFFQKIKNLWTARFQLPRRPRRCSLQPALPSCLTNSTWSRQMILCHQWCPMMEIASLLIHWLLPSA